MATFTAHGLIGQNHPYDGGVTNLTHQLLLSENSIARWSLILIGDTTKTIQWIPSPETMLEEGLLMLGLFVQQDPELRGIAENVLGTMPEEMNECPRKLLERLLPINRKLNSSFKIGFTIFRGSSLYNQMDVLQDSYLGWDTEVCLSSFDRSKPMNGGWFISRT